MGLISVHWVGGRGTSGDVNVGCSSDLGREMHGHGILTEPTGEQYDFADLHGHLQCGTNKNTFSCCAKCMSNGADLSIYLLTREI